jgi:hypothetical protein
MLVVRCVLAPSAIEGTGLFAASPIRRGEVVWRYLEPVDRTVACADLARLPAEVVAFFDRYAYSPPGTEHYVVCGDAAMYINHADDANLVDDTAAGLTHAARDIAAGEELTLDYRTICRFAAAEPYVG